MSSTYEGDETNFPSLLTFLTDGDPSRRASTWRPGLEGLADRTAWLRRRHFPGSLDIRANASAGAAQNFGACFVPTYDELWVVGEWSTNAQIYKSTQMLSALSRQTSIDAVIVTDPSHFYGVASNANGDVIITGSAAHFYTLQRSTSTWYANGWTTPGPWTRIVYVPTLDKFVAIGTVGGSLTARHTPAADIFNFNMPTTQIGGAGGWGSFTAALAVDVTTGTVVAAGLDTSNKLRIAYSTDGGDNWTTPASLASGIANPSVVDVAHGGDGFFYATISDITGTHECEVWRSPDGSTWTKVATLTANSIRHLAGFSEGLIGITGAGSIVSSVDQGVTWRRCGFVVAGTPLKVENILGRALILTSTMTYLSNDTRTSVGAAIT